MRTTRVDDNGDQKSEEQTRAAPYEVRLIPAAEKDLDDLPARLLDTLKDRHFPAIAANPREAGRTKRGKLAGLWGYDFGPRGGYRIVYEIFDAHRRIVVIAIGSHDQAYRKAGRRR